MKNVFDDPKFFEGYMKIRENKNNYNELLEQPAMRRLMPNVKGMDILELGCGFGANCMEFVQNGAESVVGIDVSERMLETAKRENGDGRIKYIRLDMKELDALRGESAGKFDFAYSSLAFHYVEDFKKLTGDIYSLLKPGGILLFSQEHPVTTATFGYNSKWIADENGEKIAFEFSNYHQPGKRSSFWFVDRVETYHRTTADIINALIETGFEIAAMDEAEPSEEAIEIYPELKKEKLKPNFLIVKAVKRKI